MRKFFVIPLFIVVLLGLLVMPARAFEADDGGIVQADQVIDDDLFIEADKVVVDGTVNGNLFANGAEVVINGPVNGNLLIFGAVAEVNGPVSGSLVFAGQSLALNGHVAGSVFAAGTSLVTNATAKIDRNVYYAGYDYQGMPGSRVAIDLSLACYQAALQGEIGRNVFAGVNALEVDGSVGGDLEVNVEAPGEEGVTLRFGSGGSQLPDALPSGIRVSEQAAIGGKLTYSSTVEQSDTIALASEQVIYQTLEIKEKLTPAEAFRKRSLAAVKEFVTLLILGALALWLLPRPLQKSSQALRRPLPSLGWGLVIFLLALPIIFLIGGAIAVCGILLGVITLENLTFLVYVGGYLALGLSVLVFSVVVIYGSKLVVAGALGDWLWRLLLHHDCERPILPLLIGISIYTLFSAIPFGAGLFVEIVVTIIGLGAMWIAYRQRNQPPELPVVASLVGPDEMIEVA